MADERERNGSVSRVVLGVLASVVTAAILAIAGFTFTTSRNVAVLTVEIRGANERILIMQQQINRNSDQIRDMEQDLVRIDERHKRER